MANEAQQAAFFVLSGIDGGDTATQLYFLFTAVIVLAAVGLALVTIGFLLFRRRLPPHFDWWVAAVVVAMSANVVWLFTWP